MVKVIGSFCLLWFFLIGRKNPTYPCRRGEIGYYCDCHCYSGFFGSFPVGLNTLWMSRTYPNNNYIILKARIRHNRLQIREVVLIDERATTVAVPSPRRITQPMTASWGYWRMASRTWRSSSVSLISGGSVLKMRTFSPQSPPLFC